jgi:YegS/Rv2252/BmrU family lipid kinase
MTLGNTLLIVNPAARHGETRKLMPVIERLMDGVTNYAIEISAGPRHAMDLARTANGFDSIIAVGGDGTAHEVINGVMTHDERLRPAFGVVPTGSGNDYAHTLGMSDDLSTALRQIAKGKRVPVDLGLCNGVWFGESVSVGLDARVTAKAVELKVSSGASGLALYLRALMFVLNKQYHSHKVAVQYDDEEPFETDMLILAATNGPTYGGGFKITPDSVYDDGLLDTCRIDALPRAQAYLRLPFVIVGRHTKMKPVHMKRAQRVTIVSERPFEGQLDGEVMLENAYDIQVVPGAMEAIVPIAELSAE